GPALFPYPTLFRSGRGGIRRRARALRRFRPRGGDRARRYGVGRDGACRDGRLRRRTAADAGGGARVAGGYGGDARGAGLRGGVRVVPGGDTPVPGGAPGPQARWPGCDTIKVIMITLFPDRGR